MKPLLILLATLPVAAMTCNVRDYGATGNGTAKETAAIQRAIAACAPAGGTVTIPAGRYLTGAIELKSNIRLDIAAGATLLGSEDPTDYPLQPNPYEPDRQERSALIFGHDLANITLSGRGTIDGRGQIWWKRQRWAHPRKGDAAPTPAETAEAQKVAEGRPHLIKIVRGKNVWIEGLTLLNSPGWTVNPVFCEFVTVLGITIVNPVPSPNTDGINPESCRNVHIANCTIDVGDDCVTIKSGKDEAGRRAATPCENITVTNCTMLQGHGGVVIGSEMSGGVRNVTVSNCVFQGTNVGIRVKSQRGRGGVVEGMTVSNIVMQDVPEAFTITTFYQGADKPDQQFAVDAGTPRFRDFRISNVTARGSKSAGQITGLKEMPISGISFDHVRIQAATGFTVRNASGIAFHNVTIDTAKGPSLRALDSSRIELDGFTTAAPHPDAPVVDFTNVREALVRESWAAEGTKQFLRINGAGSRGVVLSNNHWLGVSDPLSFGDGAAPTAVEERR